MDKIVTDNSKVNTALLDQVKVLNMVIDDLKKENKELKSKLCLHDVMCSTHDSFLLNKEVYELIENECDKHNEETYNMVDIGDVIYSFLYSTDGCFHILNDWGEGRNNDPFWNEELNEHSAIVFLKQICDKLKQYYT